MSCLFEKKKEKLNILCSDFTVKWNFVIVEVSNMDDQLHLLKPHPEPLFIFEFYFFVWDFWLWPHAVGASEASFLIPLFFFFFFFGCKYSSSHLHPFSYICNGYLVRLSLSDTNFLLAMIEVQEFYRLRSSLRAKEEHASLLEDFREFDRTRLDLEEGVDSGEQALLKEHASISRSTGQVC